MIKKIIFAMLAVCMISCEKDDDNIDPNLLIGKWYYESDTFKPPIFASLPENLMEVDCYTETTFYEFNDDNTFHLIYGEENCYNHQEKTISGEWEVNGGTLTLSIDGNETENKIQALSSTRLKMKEGDVTSEELIHVVDQFGNPVYADYDGDGVFTPVIETKYEGKERVQVLVK